MNAKKRKPTNLLASSLFLRTLARIPCSNHLFAICIALLKITEPEYTHLPTQLLVAPIPISVAAATSRPAATTTTTSTSLVTAAATASAAELLLAPVTCLIDNDRPVPQGRTV
jgi:hypothetical protein